MATKEEDIHRAKFPFGIVRTFKAAGKDGHDAIIIKIMNSDEELVDYEGSLKEHPELYDLKKLSEILNSWSAAAGKLPALGDIITRTDRDEELKRTVQFDHGRVNDAPVTWSGTFGAGKRTVSGRDVVEISIRLPNDGFLYTKEADLTSGGTVLTVAPPRHRRDDFKKFDKAAALRFFQPFITHTKAITGEDHANIEVYYSYPGKSIDIKCHSVVGGRAVSVIYAFHVGVPDHEYAGGEFDVEA